MLLLRNILEKEKEYFKIIYPMYPLHASTRIATICERSSGLRLPYCFDRCGDVNEIIRGVDNCFCVFIESSEYSRKI